MTTIPATDTEALVTKLADISEALKNLTEQKGRIEWEITLRMQARGATLLDHPDHHVELVSKPEYDRTQLYPIKEFVPPEVFDKGYTPEHEEPVTIPEKWDMRQVKTWAKYGRVAQAILERAALPVAPKLVIRPKEAT